MFTPLSSITQQLDQFSIKPTKFDSFSSGTDIKGNVGFASQHHKVNSFEIFNAVLQKAYRHMAFNPGNDSSPSGQTTRPFERENLPVLVGRDIANNGITKYERVDKISSQQAADTILNFITQRIELDKANGANQDQLLERLDQGLKGFIKGFNEAKDQIEGMGLLTSDLSEEINDTFAQVTNGIEQLRERITGINSDNNLTTTDVSRVRLAGQTYESTSFSLSLTTQDGDEITIEVSRSNQSRFSATQNSNGNSSSLNIKQQSTSSSSFNLIVNGELDDDELAAINQLLQDVDAIATDFFAGRFDEAFAQASELDINREELSSLNLQLQKTTTTKALASYQTTSQNGLSSGSINSSSPFLELDHLLDGIQNILEQAKKFEEPLQLLDQLSAGVSRISHQDNQQYDVATLGDQLSSLISQFDL